jgi:rSAM/selenodomain-associated transferase 2
MTLSIIMPVLNEAAEIVAALETLAPYRGRGVEVIVVDGGSSDGTLDLATPLCDKAIRAAHGRALQMNAGARVAKSDFLLFLHVDTRLPTKADSAVAGALGTSGKRWGRFDVRIDGGAVLGVVAAMMNLRSRLTGIATGDQAIFVTRALFHQAGGFPEIPLMEDVALSKRLRRDSHPLCLRAKVMTSGRRWQAHGVLPTILLMWRLRLAYYLGADPTSLARRYGYGARG